MRLRGHARALRCGGFGFQPFHRGFPGAGTVDLPGYNCQPISMPSRRDKGTIICAPAIFPRTGERYARKSSIPLNLTTYEAKANLHRSHGFAAAVMPLLGGCAKAALYFAAPSRKILVSSAKKCEEGNVKRGRRSGSNSSYCPSDRSSVSFFQIGSHLLCFGGFKAQVDYRFVSVFGQAQFP